MLDLVQKYKLQTLGSSTKVQILTQGAAEGVRAWRRSLLDRMGSGGSRVSRGRYALYLLY